MKRRASRMETHYVAQIRAVLERYRDAGGRAEIELFEGSGHFPPTDAAGRRSRLFFDFLASVEP
jgi:hypothetical protein